MFLLLRAVLGALVLGALLASPVSACGGQIALEKGQAVDIESINFPFAYPLGQPCLWEVFSPRKTLINLKCDYFNVRSSDNCYLDALYVSPAGDYYLRDARYYCGIGTLDITSTTNALLAYFRSFYLFFQFNTHPGFRCVLSVVENDLTVTTTTTEAPVTSVTGSSSTARPYPQDNCHCGVKGGEEESRVVGGKESEVHEWPWQASLTFQSNGIHFCGGTLIHHQWILTAAHCLSDFRKEEIQVVLGEHNLDRFDETHHTISFNIGEMILHENYNPATVDNDIALIKLDNPVTYSEGISPVCLPWRSTFANFKGETAAVTGWGTTTFQGQTSHVLVEAILPVLTTSECRQYLGNKITPNMFCTYEPGKDSCQGDSGGPLNWVNNDTGRVETIGIVSWGIACAAEGKPGVFTKITNYLDWIQQKTQAEFCNN